MKSIFTTIIFAAFAVSSAAQEKCRENPDGLYNRQQVLEQLAEMFNKEVPKESRFSKFRVKNERAVLFSVHDLTDVSNKQVRSEDDCVNFINNHVYQVSPLSYSVSYNHIVIPEDGKLKIFYAINCPLKGDKLEDVINYLDAKLANETNKVEILERVRNYREYGSYRRFCNMESLRCERIIPNKNQ